MEEQIILVSEKDEPTGSMEKLEAHEKGLLHRAFSIFVRNSAGKFLLQERAKTKYHSGGLWTNTCCGHPQVGEETFAAAHRRLNEEMGFDCPLEESFVFHYTAVLDKGLTENEIDHVFVGNYDGEVRANPKEADGFAWVSREEIEKDISSHPEKYTVWFKVAMEKAKAGGYFRTHKKYKVGL
ncbi:MAG: isopentenyl-diphosphate delta-isomerase [Candidatus Lloydbacteria bacterium RIFCSPHIGHO2_02_FULL_54_17]|uniref:Isopentenyl-diphosphate delta-isomerase n=1 Tax=Candidatus Lloydbacteria bacterium RIFCSPHIGHO2_02_FULL_54_17 TaxID=1798664 RepID=A0A1G2DF63_9BACT|nr:MAG: isopentenyl-diphosphate delta-isomerase [Candidatus Lloydbacteria bacterium RIFCSPHIGHO2_01_FULL_54_11]OGZ12275.1 MAG: isopentenyl-diphosphate delta-isomerase [Candidatus Lloydbacteria bacterium RIFCSPHIGHO2_02_FULL_54_17]OGZ13978.1 MAG: isopentenyl-diphosphate delta-isomerase [Candidatus Lloydbacteria bacterium RIFCSPLOWO2_01_FULL_54_18]OGZ16416.1 MAG: isopentenyl-diphosphate delta-isomerase [Candidatus Lloydbacteria bacterium RIFCSPLOWO2_02_FULL_54_12]